MIKRSARYVTPPATSSYSPPASRTDVTRASSTSVAPSSVATRRCAAFAVAAAAMPEASWNITRVSSSRRHCGQRRIASPASIHSYDRPTSSSERS